LSLVSFVNHADALSKKIESSPGASSLEGESLAAARQASRSALVPKQLLEFGASECAPAVIHEVGRIAVG